MFADALSFGYYPATPRKTSHFNLVSHLSLQVQGVQSLQGLQLPQGQGQAQQLTLAPVQTLPLGQTGQVSLPNLQTVTVNSVTQSGVQYTQGDDANSPVGT